jgi:Bromodomain
MFPVSGRLVATYFETLPPRDRNADYYKKTRMPISLETIQDKLDKKEFSNLSELESYIKRMITNAKEYYARGSQVYEDAERVRKATSNYMTKTNPAYQIRGYQAVPTALPPDDQDEEGEDGDGEADTNVVGEDEDADGEADDRGKNGDEEDAEGEDEDEGATFKRSQIIIRRPRRSRNANEYDGLSFQQAQEKIVDEMLNKMDPEE